MFNPLSLISIKSAETGNTNSLKGLDVLGSIQILLMQDYNDQLSSLGKQIQGTLTAKKKYRQDIQEIQKLLVNEADKDGYIVVSKEDYDLANAVHAYGVDPLTGDLTGAVDENDKELLTTKFGALDGTFIEEDGTYKLKKDGAEKLAETLNTQLDNLNEQSELMSLGIQSLTNQRKISLETVSQLVKKEGDSLELMMRNIG